MSELFRGLGVEVELVQNFNVVREAISRIGYASRSNNVLHQSCHLFHKQGRYAIMHFREMYQFDGKANSPITDDDIARRNTIIDLLVQWGMINIISKPENWPTAGLGSIMVVKHKDKHNWVFEPKYKIGGSATATA